MATPYLTSDGIIESVKRKISFPISQVTFTEADILKFANEEMLISQVPSVLSFHEEYYVTTLTVPLVSSQNRYPIPNRAIGMKLRDLFWSDQNGNLFEMTRISSEDRAFFQRNVGANQAIHKFYLEGNDVVLTPTPIADPTGSLVFVYFIRPSQLVRDSEAAIIASFFTKVTLNNASIVAGDTISIGGQTFTAVAGAPATGEFQIGVDSIATATNLVTALNTNGIVSASNNSSASATIEATFSTVSFAFTTTNSSGFSVWTRTGVNFTSIPTTIADGSVIDFLQTKSGHKIKGIDITIPTGGVSGTQISFDLGDVPADLVVGDYVCTENECIIPYLPDDLHSGLAERTCARILASLGAVEELAATNSKIQEIEQRQATLLDNRVEGAPQKIIARHSMLRYNKMGVTRRGS